MTCFGHVNKKDDTIYRTTFIMYRKSIRLYLYVVQGTKQMLNVTE